MMYKTGNLIFCVAYTENVITAGSMFKGKIKEILKGLWVMPT